MNHWILLAIVGEVSYAISSTLDKSIAQRAESLGRVNTTKMLFDGLLLLPFAWNQDWSVMRGVDFVWIAVMGAFYGASGRLYFQALKLGDADLLLPYAQAAIVVVSFGFGVWLFDEPLHILAVVGVACSGLGVAVLMRGGGREGTVTARGVLLISGCIVFNVAFLLIAKVAVSRVPAPIVSPLMYLSATLFLSLLGHPPLRPSSIRKTPRLFVAAVFGSAGTYCVFSALEMGHASIVYALQGVYPLMIFIFAAIFYHRRFLPRRAVGVLAVCAGIASIFVSTKDPAHAGVASPERSEFRLTPLRGADVGKVVSVWKKGPTLVSLWSTWCDPCVRELPDLLGMRRKLRERGFRLVLISTDAKQQREDAKAVLQKLGVDFETWVRDESDVVFIEGVDPTWSGSLPAHILFDARGKKVQLWEGEVKLDVLQKAVESVLR